MIVTCTFSLFAIALLLNTQIYSSWVVTSLFFCIQKNLLSTDVKIIFKLFSSFERYSAISLALDIVPFDASLKNPNSDRKVTNESIRLPSKPGWNRTTFKDVDWTSPEKNEIWLQCDNFQRSSSLYAIKC